jgi:hypothetical protein
MTVETVTALLSRIRIMGNQRWERCSTFSDATETPARAKKNTSSMNTITMTQTVSESYQGTINFL